VKGGVVEGLVWEGRSLEVLMKGWIGVVFDGSTGGKVLLFDIR
jgi:hypothetical protein